MPHFDPMICKQQLANNVPIGGTSAMVLTDEFGDSLVTFWS